MTAARERRVPVPTGAGIAASDYGGAGRDVLLLHGAERSMADWRLGVPLLLEAGLRVTAMDFPGHGDSGAKPWAWPAVMEDVAAVVIALGLDRPAMIGHSLGGMAAAVWATGHAECPLAVNVDGHGSPRGPERFAGLDREAALRAMALLEDFIKESREGGSSPEIDQLYLGISDIDMLDVYRRAVCPLLIVSADWPDLEAMAPPAVARALGAYQRGTARDLGLVAKANPLVSLATAPGNHDLHLEVPQQLVGLILDALGKGRER